MNQPDDPAWLAREYDYRADVPCLEMAERYGVTPQQIAGWKVRFGWERGASRAQLLKIKLKRVLFAAQTELLRGDLEDCNKRLKTLGVFVKLHNDIEQLGQVGSDKKQAGKKMHDADREQDRTDANGPTLDELREELFQHLEIIVGEEETKSAFASAGLPISAERA